MNSKKIILTIGFFLSSLCVPHAYGMHGIGKGLVLAGTASIAGIIGLSRHSAAEYERLYIRDRNLAPYIHLRPEGEATVPVSPQDQRALTLLYAHCGDSARYVVEYCQPHRMEFAMTAEQLAKIKGDDVISTDYNIQRMMPRACHRPFWGLVRPRIIASDADMRFAVFCCTDRVSHNAGEELIIRVNSDGSLSPCGWRSSWDFDCFSDDPAKPADCSMALRHLASQWKGEPLVGTDKSCNIAITDFDAAARGGTVIRGCIYTTQDVATGCALARALAHKDGQRSTATKPKEEVALAAPASFYTRSSSSQSFSSSSSSSSSH